MRCSRLLLCLAAGVALSIPHEPAHAQLGTPPGFSVGTSGQSCSGSSIQYGWPDANGQVLKCVSNVWTTVNQTAAAGGSNTQVQYNSSGGLAGDSGLTYVNPNLTIGYGSLYIGTSAATSGTLYIGGVGAHSNPAADTNCIGCSIAIGYGALANMPAMPVGTNIYGNIAIGTQAMNASMTTAATGNVGIGYQTMLTLTSGNNNTALGRAALTNATTGNGNTALGSLALQNMATNTQNTAVGRLAGQYINSSGNTVIGYSALQGTNTNKITGGNNTAIGYGAGTNMQGASASDILFGTYAGANILSGSNNIAIGSAVASTTLTSGSNNILIGTNSGVDTPTATTNNFLNIGNLIYGTNIGTAATPGNVGIGTVAPSTLLQVWNASTAFTNFSGGAESITSTNATTPILSIIGTGAADLFRLTGPSSAPVLYVQSGGNIGIGTTTAQAFVDILQNANSSSGGIRVASTNNGHNIRLWSDGTNARISGDSVEAGNILLNGGGTGFVGIGSSSPTVALDVNSALYGHAVSISTTTVNWTQGNVQGTSQSCGAFSFSGMQDGGSYTLTVEGTTSGTCSFSNTDSPTLTFKMPSNHGATTASTMTLYHFTRRGTNVFVTWMPGY